MGGGRKEGISRKDTKEEREGKEEGREGGGRKRKREGTWLVHNERKEEGGVIWLVNNGS